MSDQSIFLLTILQKLFITLEIKANEPKSSMSVMAWALPSSYSALIESELIPPDCSSQVPLSTHLQINLANGSIARTLEGREGISSIFLPPGYLSKTQWLYLLCGNFSHRLAFRGLRFHQSLGSVITNTSLCLSWLG